MKPAAMETKVKRTLVKSAPELWELADDQARMEVWIAGVVGTVGTVDVQVTHREPERVLAFQTANGGPFGRIAIELAEKGFGTAVTIVAEHERSAPHASEALENLLDELGSPERKPFARA